MKWEYRAILLIFTVLGLWVPIWITFDFIPFPYLLYVIIFYYYNFGLFGIVVGILGLSVGTLMLLDMSRVTHKEGESGETYDIETLAEKRP